MTREEIKELWYNLQDKSTEEIIMLKKMMSEEEKLDLAVFETYLLSSLDPNFVNWACPPLIKDGKVRYIKRISQI